MAGLLKEKYKALVASVPEMGRFLRDLKISLNKEKKCCQIHSGNKDAKMGRDQSLVSKGEVFNLLSKQKGAEPAFEVTQIIQPRKIEPHKPQPVGPVLIINQAPSNSFSFGPPKPEDEVLLTNSAVYP